jgi:CubicO group peptidase (beta-lactamase class C family)
MQRMKRAIKIFAGVIVLLFLGLAGVAGYFLWASAEVGAGYAAKLLASGVFVAGRTPESIAEQELGVVPFLHYTIDPQGKTATAWTLRGARTAVYREGLGVALALDGDVEALRRQARPGLIPDRAGLASAPWPMGDAPSGKARPAGIDEAALTSALDRMFEEPNPYYKRRTRAVVVLYDGEIIAERYGPGFGPEQRLIAWSVSKSVLHALFGIAVRDGKIDIHAPAGLWPPEDPRAAITTDMLLRMSSGLDFNEFDSWPPAPLTTMLYLQPGAAGFATSLPLLHPPDKVWAYASATSNALSQVLRNAYGDDAYYELPHRQLFEKIGMRSALIEADAAGTYVGSSYVYATARDFARFGLLYANEGVWNGERILPEGWVDYARTPTPGAGKGQYGAHWWLPSTTERAMAEARGVPLPPDTFHASGFEGQKIVVMPSRKVVIVRLGLQYFSNYPPYDYVCDLLEALPETLL